MENGNAVVNYGGTISTADLPARTLLLGQRPDGWPDAALGFQISTSVKGDLDYTSTGFHFWAYNGAWVNPMNITSGGNVGIGTTNPQNALSVLGTIQATEVLVNTGWSDYVFAPRYRLAPLTEIAAYIQRNRHLPDIPSASEVREKGVSLGEMQSKLLAKIEELTLHMIREDERNTLLERQNRDLQARIARLETVK